MLGQEIIVGLGLFLVTTTIHGLFMWLGIRGLEWMVALYPRKAMVVKVVIVSLFNAWMFVGIVLEGLVWAWYYLSNPEITVLPDLATALYFSMVTFTSVGYGDIVLTGSWRMLASLQAANGVIIFGWTTGLIFYVIQQVFKKTDSAGR